MRSRDPWPSYRGEKERGDRMAETRKTEDLEHVHDTALGMLVRTAELAFDSAQLAWLSVEFGKAAKRKEAGEPPPRPPAPRWNTEDYPAARLRN